MTIESNSPTVLNKAHGAHSAGKSSAGHFGGAKPGAGFAGLVSALSAQDETTVSVVDLALADPGLLGQAEELSVTLDDQVRDDSNFIANMVLQSAGQPSVTDVKVAPEQVEVPKLFAAVATSSPMVSEAEPVPTPDTPPASLQSAARSAPTQPLPLADEFHRTPVIGNQKADLTEDVPRYVSTLESPGLPATQVAESLSIADDVVNNKPARKTSGHDAKVLQAGSTSLSGRQTATLQAQSKLPGMPLDVTNLFKPPLDNSKTKSTLTPVATDSLTTTPGMFDKLGISSTYAVVQASAVVADTQVAETVSYWVTHGVQKAELMLDGLGSEPVEVHISVEGDQARVDFRSNQAEVRQVIEAAAGQLKGLLSNEGLQLLGMSVGTSGQGSAPGDERQPKPAAARQVRVSGADAITAGSRPVANSSVGQALDLYV